MRPQIKTAVFTGLLVGLGSINIAIAADASGKALYDKSCAGCHGPDGKGNEKMKDILGVKDLSVVSKETVKKSDDQLLKVIAEGSGKMPAAKLTKDEQKETLNYVRSLAK